MEWYYQIICFVALLKGIDLKVQAGIKDESWRDILGGILVLFSLYFLGAFQ